MSRKYVLRIIALCMLIVAIVFVVAALSNPGFGHVWTIGPIKITASVKRILYSGYALIILCLLIVSFFVKDQT